MTRTRSSLTYRTLLALALLCGISIGSLSAVAAVPANADISTTAPAWHAGWKLPTPNKGIIKFSNNAKRDMQIYFHELNALNRPVSGAKSRFRFALGGWNNGKSFAAVDEAASGSTYDYHIEGVKILGPDGNPYSAGPSQAGLTGTAQEYWCAYDEGLFIIGRGKTVNAASIIFLHKATPKTATHFGFSSYDGTQKFTNIRVEPLPANPFWKNATIPVGSSHNYAANEQKQIFTLPGSGYVKFDLFGSKKSEIELKDKDGGFVARVLIGYAATKSASHHAAVHLMPALTMSSRQGNNHCGLITMMGSYTSVPAATLA